ncbi:MAG: energy transducer TonB [Prevotella sp.]|nr:energy transducer TonB [Prevotella sp.]
MKRGKRICNTLKEVRMQVAKANDIRYAPTECYHEGDCAGTCPKCESEVRWLEQQLQLRRQLGKAVAVMGVSMGLASLTACGGKTTPLDPGSDSLSIAAQTAGFLDPVPDSLLTINQASQANETDQNDEHGTPSAVSQAVEPEYSVPAVGEVLPSPSFPGGEKALLEFLQKNVRYPEQAVKDSVEGRVVVSFEVESDGTITNAQVVKNLHPLLDAEALRVVNLMPKWEPGSLSRYNLPIFFKMD